MLLLTGGNIFKNPLPPNIESDLKKLQIILIFLVVSNSVGIKKPVKTFGLDRPTR